MRRSGRLLINKPKTIFFFWAISPILKYISYICSCPSGHYILMKVFSLLSLDRNLVNFNKNKDKLITPITCRGALCPCAAYRHNWCGVSFICSWAYQSLYPDKRIAPHFFCLIDPEGAGRIN